MPTLFDVQLDRFRRDLWDTATAKNKNRKLITLRKKDVEQKRLQWAQYLYSVQFKVLSQIRNKNCSNVIPNFCGLLQGDC